jgi:hypothetical protein
MDIHFTTHELIQLLICFIVATITRLLFIFSSRAFADSSDRQVYLWFMEILNRDFSIRKRQMSNALIADIVPIPLIPHYFASRLNLKSRIPFLICMNILSDLLLLLLFALVLKNNVFIPYSGSLLFPLLWLGTSPILHPPGARLNSLGARVFANLLFFIFIVAVFMAKVGLIWKVLAVITVVVTLNTSTFGSQALFFFSVLLSLVRLDPSPTVFFIIGFIIASIIPSGTYIQWRARMSHYSWYLKFMNRATKISLRKHWSHLNSGDPIQFISGLLVSNSFTAVLLMVPCFLLVFIPEEIFVGEGQIFIRQLGCCAFIMLFFCSFYPGAIWGEAERYMEMFTPFALIYAFTFPSLMMFSDIQLIFLGWNICFLVLNFLALENRNFKFISGDYGQAKEMAELIKFLKKYPDKNILTFPIKLNYKLSIELKDKNFLYFNYDHKTGFNYYFKYISDKMYQPKDDPSLIRELGTTLMVGSLENLANMTKVKSEAGLIFDDGKYQVWKLNES